MFSDIHHFPHHSVVCEVHKAKPPELSSLWICTFTSSAAKFQSENILPLPELPNDTSEAREILLQIFLADVISESSNKDAPLPLT